MNIRDIAAAANVSVSTVSKVLNQKDHDISEATRERVLAVIKEYNYTPYSNIKETQTGKSFMIALVIHPSLMKRELITTLEQNLSASGYSLLLCTLDASDYSLERQLNVLRSKRVEGIIFHAVDERYIESFNKGNSSGIPSVFLYEKPIADQVCIRYDYSSIAYTAVRLLINHGHTRIGCVLDAASDNSTSAGNGYLRALFESSLSRDESLIISCKSDAHNTHAAFEQLFEQDITALYCQNAVLAASAYTFLHEMNLSIPDEVSIVCGETNELAQILYPPVTSVELPYDTLGKVATKSILDMVETHAVRPKSLSIEPVIHKGDSLALPSACRTKIAVIGNMTMDIIISTKKIPSPGELIVSNNIFSTPGGKGINQAIGAGKLGGFVYAIGRLGDDAEGHTISDTLSTYNIKTDGIYIDGSTSTGKAFIAVPDGNNSCVISYPGANSFFDVEQLNKCTHLLTNTDYCLISTELAPEVVAYAIKRCQKLNVKIFLKPSTTGKIEQTLLRKIDYLVPNEAELAVLAGGNDTIQEKAERLYHMCQNTIIVTLGARGCYLKNSEYSHFFRAAPFTPVDTTGAANCFISALAVSLGEGNDLPYSICFATYAAGLSVTQQGTQLSFPSRAQLDIYQDDIHAMYVECGL